MEEYFKCRYDGATFSIVIGVFKIEKNTYNVAEDQGSVEVTVVRVKGDDESHGIQLKTEDITADRDDYVAYQRPIDIAKVIKNST